MQSEFLAMPGVELPPLAPVEVQVGNPYDWVPKAPNECCRQPHNYTPRPDLERERPGLMAKSCDTCRRRHFKLKVEPGVFQSFGNPTG